MTSKMKIQGKAFEFAVLDSLCQLLEKMKVGFEVNSSVSCKNAEKSFDQLKIEERLSYRLAASTGIEMIQPLEPRLTLGKDASPLLIDIQSDAKGQAGDVRDVVCLRDSEGWELGISCKHNHEAVKHPRITQDADFGTDWIGKPCSPSFHQRMEEVRSTTNSWIGTTWKSHGENKEKLVYYPILEAYVDELKSICCDNREACENLLKYFLGYHDFYKIIAFPSSSKENSGFTKVMGFNMNKTLALSAKGRRSLHSVPRVKFPRNLLGVSIKEGSKTTLELTFDEGWAISMRIHSADTLVKFTGLKWDIQFKGIPSNLYVQERSWSLLGDDLYNTDVNAPGKHN